MTESPLLGRGRGEALSTMLKLIENDPWLEPYEDAIQGRYDYYVRRKNELTDNGAKKLKDVAKGYEYYGLHKTKKGWMIKDGIAVRVVSVPSEGLFRDQPKSYQESVLPADVVRYGMTSGLPVTLLGLVGSLDNIHGLDHFGHSAPFKVLDEKFGYNGETVYNEVKKLLAK